VPKSWGFHQVIPMFLKVPHSLEGASRTPNIYESAARVKREVAESKVSSQQAGPGGLGWCLPSTIKPLSLPHRMRDFAETSIPKDIGTMFALYRA